MTSSYAQGSVEKYVEEVLRWIPRPLPERDRIAMDLQSHFADELEAGVAEDDALRRMGSAEEVAKGYLAEVEFTEASVMRRLGAFLIDLSIGMVLLAFLAVVIWSLIESGSLGITGMGVGVLWEVAFVLVFLLAIAIPVLSVLYFPFQEAVFDRTVGKRALGIYVTREGGESTGWGPAIVRRIPFFFDIFWLDAVFALFTRRRQRAFDRVARTVVVRR